MRSLIIVLILITSPAFGHDGGVPNWITEKFPYCCGENDCERISQADIELLPQGVRIKATGEIIVYTNLKQSLDGDWWRCHVTQSPQVTRCLFAPGVS